MMAAPMSAESAVGSSTTSSTSAVQLSVLPDCERGRNQRAGGILGSGALAQDVGDGSRSRQKPVHAVAAQQEAVVQRHRLGRVVEPHFGLDAKRAGESVATGRCRPRARGRW